MPPRSIVSLLVGKVLGAAGDRRIVAVVRDVHRHPWMADALDALIAARPDTVVVEMGVPGPIRGGPCTSRPMAPPASADGPPRRSSPARAPGLTDADRAGRARGNGMPHGGTPHVRESRAGSWPVRWPSSRRCCGASWRRARRGSARWRAAIAARRPALRAAHGARYVRQRRALREVSAGDPARSAVRADLHVHDDGVRRAARPDGRPGHHGQPVRRLTGPGGLHQGGAGGGRDHAWRSRTTRTRRWRRSPSSTSTSWRARRRRFRRRRRTRVAAGPLSARGGAAGR